MPTGQPDRPREAPIGLWLRDRGDRPQTGLEVARSLVAGSLRLPGARRLHAGADAGRTAAAAGGDWHQVASRSSTLGGCRLYRREIALRGICSAVRDIILATAPSRWMLPVLPRQDATRQKTSSVSLGCSHERSHGTVLKA